MADAVGLEPERLLRMPSAEFKALVGLDIRGEADERDHRTLRDPLVVGRWLSTLRFVVRNVEGTLAARSSDHQRKKAKFLRGDNRTAWLELVVHHQEQRAKSIRFLSRALEAMEEAKFLFSQLHPGEAALKDERDRYIVAYHRLRGAIQVHKQHTCGEECDTKCPADIQLWSELTVNQ